MPASSKAIRSLIFAFILALLGALVWLSWEVRTELRNLETAPSDNFQWNFAQLEVELARFDAALARQPTPADRFGPQPVLRFELWLSRSNQLNQGLLRQHLEGAPAAQAKLSEIAARNTEIETVLTAKGRVTHERLTILRNFVAEQAKAVRNLALTGISLAAKADAQRRAEFATLIRRTGAAALLLLLALSGALVLLAVMYRRAQTHDREARMASDLMERTISASLDAIIVADHEGRILNINHAASKIFGLSAATAPGKFLHETVIPPDLRDAHRAGMTRLQKGGPARVVDQGRLELPALHADGHIFPVELNISSAETADGTIFISYLQDITARKQAEADLVAAKDRAEAADRAKSQFLAVMTHEMRTPLHGLLGVFDLLRDTTLTPAQSGQLDVASAAAEVLLQHVTEALDITQIEAGQLSLNPAPAAPGAIVQGACDLLRPLAQEKGLSLHLSIAPESFALHMADATRLRQVITNLVGNAIKFTQTGHVSASLNVSHADQDTFFELKVADTGPGIPDSERDRIFERFVKLGQADENYADGSGLGLSIAQSIAGLMGSKITHRNLLGAGSEFTFCFSLARTTPAHEVDMAPIPDAQLAPLRILLVDDHAANRALVSQMARADGHSVAEAADGLEAVKMAANTSFDVILMDISMPNMNGLEATRAIRQKDGPNQTSRILGLSAHDVETTRQSALSAGMDDFLTKPLRRAQLREVLLGEAHPAPPPLGLLDLSALAELSETLSGERLSATLLEFIQEAETALPGLSALDPDARHDSLHRLKGAAGMLGLPALAHALQSAITDHATPVEQALHDTVAELTALDLLMGQSPPPKG